MKKILNKGAILLLSGPSGCGKSSLLKNLYKNIDNYYFSISTTTRSPRDGEQHGKEYYFVTKEEFEEDIKNDNFLEWAKVHDNYYGTSLKPIVKALEESKLVIFDIDVQGFKIVKEKLDYLTTSVFITTATLNELESRLINRATDSKETIKVRLENASQELQDLNLYDYLIVNDDLQTASNNLLNIANIAKLKTSTIDIKSFLQIWDRQ
jgi:guanylate kinase